MRNVGFYVWSVPEQSEFLVRKSAKWDLKLVAVDNWEIIYAADVIQLSARALSLYTPNGHSSAQGILSKET
jgi:hypothetical protein